LPVSQLITVEVAGYTCLQGAGLVSATNTVGSDSGVNPEEPRNDFSDISEGLFLLSLNKETNLKESNMLATDLSFL